MKPVLKYKKKQAELLDKQSKKAKTCDAIEPVTQVENIKVNDILVSFSGFNLK